MPETTAAPDPDSPLKRKDTPPGGVDEQFDSGFGIPNVPCNTRMSLETTVERTVEIGALLVVCTDGGFDDGDIDVSVTGASGETVGSGVIRSVESGGHVPVLIPLVPGIPLGQYEILADQSAIGGPIARAALTITAATRPVAAAQPLRGPRGTAFTFGWAGLDPNAAYTTYLYRRIGPAPGDLVGSTWEYLTQLSFVSDESGTARIVIASEPDDEAGLYLLETPGQGSVGFELT